MIIHLIKNSGFALLALLLVTAPAIGGDWTAEGRGGFSGNYSDNPTMRPDDQDPDSKFSTLASLAFTFETQEENARFSFKPRVTRNYYVDRDFSEAESTNLYIESNASLARERASYSLGLNASDQGILVSEQDDTGNFNAIDDSRQSLTISPSANWLLTERDQLTLGFTYNDTNFDKDFTGRSDFDTKGVRLGYTRTITPRHTVGISGLYSDFSSSRKVRAINPQLPFCTEDPPPANINDCDPENVIIVEIDGTIEGRAINDTEGYSYSINYNYLWTETTSVGLTYGEQSSDLETTLLYQGVDFLRVDERDNESTQYAVDVVSDQEKGSLEFGVSRSVVPSSNGTPQNRDRVSARWIRQLRPNVTGNFFFLGSKQESISDIGSTVRGESTSWRAEAEFSWAFSRRFSLSGKYTYMSRERDDNRIDDNLNDDGTATQNILSFGMGYKFDI